MLGVGPAIDRFSEDVIDKQIELVKEQAPRQGKPGAWSWEREAGKRVVLTGALRQLFVILLGVLRPAAVGSFELRTG